MGWQIVNREEGLQSVTKYKLTYIVGLLNGIASECRYKLGVPKMKTQANYSSIDFMN